MFMETGLIKTDISFAKGDQYTILRLNKSKIDMEHTEVLIILAAIGKCICQVTTLRHQFIQDPYIADAPLLHLQSIVITRQGVVNILK